MAVGWLLQTKKSLKVHWVGSFGPLVFGLIFDLCSLSTGGKSLLVGDNIRSNDSCGSRPVLGRRWYPAAGVLEVYLAFGF